MQLENVISPLFCHPLIAREITISNSRLAFHTFSKDIKTTKPGSITVSLILIKTIFLHIHM